MSFIDFRAIGIKASTALITVSLLLTAAGCSSEKIYSESVSSEASQESSVDTMSYTYVSELLSAYDTALNQFMRDHRDQSVSTETDGTTYAGKAAHCTYTTSDDGVYRVLQMEINTDDTTVVDEYFDLGEAMFMARSTYHTDTGSFDAVDKYYIKDGIVYRLNPDTQTLDALANTSSDNAGDAQTELDMYFSFDEITAIYG